MRLKAENPYFLMIKFSGRKSGNFSLYPRKRYLWVILVDLTKYKMSYMDMKEMSHTSTIIGQKTTKYVTSSHIIVILLRTLNQSKSADFIFSPMFFGRKINGFFEISKKGIDSDIRSRIGANVFFWTQRTHFRTKIIIPADSGRFIKF